MAKPKKCKCEKPHGFEVPYIERAYVRCYVDDNGAIAFGEDGHGWDGREEDRTKAVCLECKGTRDISAMEEVL